MAKLQAIRFYFCDDPTWDGFADGTTWNGFDNVWVTPEVHSLICEHFRKDYATMGEDQAGVDYLMQSFDDLEMVDGLYSYAYGFATSIDEDHYHIINR